MPQIDQCSDQYESMHGHFLLGSRLPEHFDHEATPRGQERMIFYNLNAWPPQRVETYELFKAGMCQILAIKQRRSICHSLPLSLAKPREQFDTLLHAFYKIQNLAFEKELRYVHGYSQTFRTTTANIIII